jgi:hypothetical protein
MKVISYLNSVPRINNNAQKTDLLIKFIEGVNQNNDNGLLNNKSVVEECDVAVIQGWVHNKINTPHLHLRKEIIDHQARIKKYTCVADANLFLYANKYNPHGYLRYSFNGVFPNTGIYFDENPTSTRWQQISNDLNIRLESTKTSGKNVVVCLQRDGGWSMGRTAVVDWVTNTINDIKRHTDRTIILRPHPGDKKALQTYIPQLAQRFKHDSQIKFSSKDNPLEADLSKAWAVVNHNSSAIVGPIIQVYHAFVTDSSRSQCAEVAHTDFSMIEKPQQFDRQRWLERISMFHWKFSELEDGSAWRHMRNYVRQ